MNKNNIITLFWNFLFIKLYKVIFPLILGFSMCIIACIPTKEGPLLLKNRDRNYKVNLKSFRLELGGMECLVVADALTEWIEGMNEAGICIVNSALMVGRDEKEKKKSKKGKKSKDGARILRALRFDNKDEVIESLINFKDGVKGHTFITTPTGIFALETTSKHDPIIKELDPNTLHVRTNHGIYHEDAGYTKGEDYVSSQVRMRLALDKLEGVQNAKEVIEVINAPVFDKKSPYNMVRHTDKMKTSSQFVMSPNEKALYVHYNKENVESFSQADLRKDSSKGSLTLKVIK